MYKKKKKKKKFKMLKYFKGTLACMDLMIQVQGQIVWYTVYIHMNIEDMVFST